MWLFTKYGFYSAVCARQGDGGVVKGREKLVWSCFGLSVPLLDVFVAQAAIRCLGDDSCAWR
jgi:hypothetical protein